MEAKNIIDNCLGKGYAMDSYAGAIGTIILYCSWLIQSILLFTGDSSMDENWVKFGLSIAASVLAMIILVIQQAYSMRKDAKNFDDVKERIRDTKTDVKEKVDANKNTLEKEHEQILQGQNDLSQQLASIREDQIRVQDKQDFMKEQLPTAFNLQKDVQNILNTLAEKEIQLNKIREELQQSKSQVSRLEKELETEKEEKWKLSNELHEIKYEVKMPKGFHPDHKDSYDTVDY